MLAVVVLTQHPVQSYPVYCRIDRDCKVLGKELRSDGNHEELHYTQANNAGVGLPPPVAVMFTLYTPGLALGSTWIEATGNADSPAVN